LGVRNSFLALSDEVTETVCGAWPGIVRGKVNVRRLSAAITIPSRV
jgi:hypothetical protein